MGSRVGARQTPVVATPTLVVEVVVEAANPLVVEAATSIRLVILRLVTRGALILAKPVSALPAGRDIGRANARCHPPRIAVHSSRWTGMRILAFLLKRGIIGVFAILTF
jgi:hypothetical protein